MSAQRSEIELVVFLQEMKPCNIADAGGQAMGPRAQQVP